MPPPSSPNETRHSTWDLSSASISDNDNLGNEFESDGDLGHENTSGNTADRRRNRLHSLNLLSSLFLNPRYLQEDFLSWRNRGTNSSEDNQLRINNVPIEIRNINLDDVRPFQAIFTDLSDDDYEYDDYEDEYYEENEGDHESDNYYDNNIIPGEPNNDGNTLRSDIQMNERLLLSSARQNHTNTNTIISLPESENRGENNLGGVSLRRQNAIRRFRSRDNEDELAKSGQLRMRKEAKVIYRDIHEVFSLMKSISTFPGESTLFSTHNNFHRVPNKLHKELAENIFSNLDSSMDNFLIKSRSGKLWQESSRLSRKCRSMSKKRKFSTESNSNVKRQKIQSSSYEQESEINNKLTEDLNFNILHSEHRRSVLNVLSSSFLKVGSLYNLKMNKEKKRNIDSIFTFVDYRSKKLEGFFSISSNKMGHNHNIIYQKLREFKNYFTGTGFGVSNTPRNKILGKKLKLLKSLDEEIGYNLKVSDSEPGVKQFPIPFDGKMIDFSKNDMRFLSYIDMSSNLRIRNLHIARAKSARVRLQLGEWMRIEPFRKFRETFFIHNLSELDENLRGSNYSKLPTGVKEESIESGKGIIANLYDLTKDFEFIRNRDCSIPILEEEEIVREFKVDDNKPNYFLQNWQRSLSDKLCEFLTCDDYCLLKIQLNYILFTLLVDLDKFLDDYLEFVLKFCPDTIKKKYQALYKSLPSFNKSDDTKNAILLCSINRKSGEMEIQNSRAYLNYRNIYQLDCQIRNRNNISSGANEGVTGASFPAIIPQDQIDDESYTEEIKYQDPYLHEVPTMLSGYLNQTNKKSNSIGGGNPSYGFV